MVATRNSRNTCTSVRGLEEYSEDGHSSHPCNGPERHYPVCEYECETDALHECFLGEPSTSEGHEVDRKKAKRTLVSGLLTSTRSTQYPIWPRYIAAM